MLPVIFEELNEEMEFDQDEDYEIEPSLTYRLNKNDTISGMVDGQEAVIQAVEKIFQTERYESLAYSWDYGIELKDLSGKPAEYVIPELKRRIQEAIGTDDRITGVDSFVFRIEGRIVEVKCIVHNIFGEIELMEEVKIDV